MITKAASTLSTTALFITLLICVIERNTKHEQRLGQRNSDRNCTTDLAVDLYGLGVRLGVYFQWVSGWVSNNFLVDSISSGLDANAIFLFALLIAIVSNTRTNAMTLMDGLIMIWLCAGTVWSVLSLWGYRTCVYRKKGLNGISKFGGFGTHLRLLLSGSVAAYGAWYWIFAIKGGQHGLEPFGQVDPSCGKSSVTVFNTDISGISSNAALALSIVAGVYAAVVILVTPISAYTRVWKMIIFWRTQQFSSNTRLRYATGASRRQLEVASRILGGFNLLWIVFCMVAIEVTLNENYAVGVLGANPESGKNLLQPGQLLPLLIGSFSFIQTLFNVYELWRYPFSADTAPSLGRVASSRWAKAKIGPANGFNVFRLFSEGSSEDEEQKRRKSSHNDDEADPYLDLHLRLNPFQRILITVFPHLSLFYFWPWKKDASHEIIHDLEEDRVQLNTFEDGHGSRNSERARFVHEESAVVKVNDQSRPQSPTHYDPHQVRETV